MAGYLDPWLNPSGLPQMAGPDVPVNSAKPKRNPWDQQVLGDGAAPTGPTMRFDVPGGGYFVDQYNQGLDAARAGNIARGVGIGVRGALTTPLVAGAEAVQRVGEEAAPILQGATSFGRGFLGLADVPPATTNAVAATLPPVGGQGRSDTTDNTAGMQPIKTPTSVPVQEQAGPPQALQNPNQAWTNPDGTQSGFYHQSETAATARNVLQPQYDTNGNEIPQYGSVTSIPASSMTAISPELGRQLYAAKAAAADRGDLGSGSGGGGWTVGMPTMDEHPFDAEINRLSNSDGIVDQWKGRRLQRARDADLQARAALQNSAAATTRVANELPIARMHDLTSRYGVDAVYGAHQMTDATTRRGQNLVDLQHQDTVAAAIRAQNAGFAPHAGTAAIQAEAAKYALLGTPEGDARARALYALTIPRFEPEGRFDNVKPDGLGGIISSGPNGVTTTTAAELKVLADKRMKDAAAKRVTDGMPTMTGP